MKTGPFVSIILSVYNNENTLRACLDSLLEIDYKNYEVILVNDASTDSTLSIMKEYANKKIKVVSYKINKGVPGARNEGMKKAKGSIYVFSDGDCTFDKSWPMGLIKALKDPKVGFSGGRDKAPPGEPLVKRCVDYTMTSFIGTAGLRGSDKRISKYAVTGCNFAVKKSVVDKIGMHNEKIRWRGEEKEWSQRARDASYDIKFVAESFVLHYRRISLKSFWNQTFKSGQARYDIVKAAPKALEIVHLAPSLLIIGLILTGILSFVTIISFYAFLLSILAYSFLLIVQSLIGAIKVGNILAFFIVPVTTIIMHFAYGFGLIQKVVFSEKS